MGAGLAAAGSVDLSQLGTSFFLPLGLSPLLNLVLAAGLYPLFRTARLWMGVERRMCLCIEGEEPQPVQLQPSGGAVLQSTGLSVSVGQMESCMERYQGRVVGIDAQSILDRLHFLSAGAVGFARGLNDAPKIVALLIAASGLGMSLATSLLAVGVTMAMGGAAQRPPCGADHEHRHYQNEPRAGVHRQPGDCVPGRSGVALGNPGVHHTCVMRQPFWPRASHSAGKESNHTSDPDFLVDHPTSGCHLRGADLLAVPITTVSSESQQQRQIA